MISRNRKIDIWKNGKYIDLWSVNHTLAGCLLGALTFFFRIDFIFGFAVSILLMVGWEIYEIIYKVEETPYDRISDVVTGVLGFLAIFALFPKVQIKTADMIFIGILGLWIFLEWWGYMAYRTIEKSKNGLY